MAPNAATPFRAAKEDSLRSPHNIYPETNVNITLIFCLQLQRCGVGIPTLFCLGTITMQVWFWCSVNDRPLVRVAEGGGNQAWAEKETEPAQEQGVPPGSPGCVGSRGARWLLSP